MSEGCVTRDLVANDSIGPQGESPDTKSKADNIQSSWERIRDIFLNNYQINIDNYTLPVNSRLKIVWKEEFKGSRSLRETFVYIYDSNKTIPEVLRSLAESLIRTVPDKVAVVDDFNFYDVLESAVEKYELIVRREDSREP